jgi:hypothetical protein
MSHIGEVNRCHCRPPSARGIVGAHGGMLSSLRPSTTYVTAPPAVRPLPSANGCSSIVAGATLHCQRPMPIANRLQAAECRATYDDSSGHARALARRHGVSKRWPIPLSPSRNPSTSRQEIDDCRWPSTIVRARDARAKRNQAGVAIRHKQSDSKKTNGGSSRQFEPG